MKGVENNEQKVISCFLHISNYGWTMMTLKSEEKDYEEYFE